MKTASLKKIKLIGHILRIFSIISLGLVVFGWAIFTFVYFFFLPNSVRQYLPWLLVDYPPLDILVISQLPLPNSAFHFVFFLIVLNWFFLIGLGLFCIELFSQFAKGLVLVPKTARLLFNISVLFLISTLYRWVCGWASSKLLEIDAPTQQQLLEKADILKSVLSTYTLHFLKRFVFPGYHEFLGSFTLAILFLVIAFVFKQAVLLKTDHDLTV